MYHPGQLWNGCSPVVSLPPYGACGLQTESACDTLHSQRESLLWGLWVRLKGWPGARIQHVVVGCRLNPEALWDELHRGARSHTAAAGLHGFSGPVMETVFSSGTARHLRTWAPAPDLAWHLLGTCAAPYLAQMDRLLQRPTPSSTFPSLALLHSCKVLPAWMPTLLACQSSCQSHKCL